MEGLGLSAVPSEVWESGEVIKLNLSRNSIQELPVELSSCVSLQVKPYLLVLFPVRCCNKLATIISWYRWTLSLSLLSEKERVTYYQYIRSHK